MTLAEAAGICIAVSEKILRRAEDADYDRIVERLSQKSSARGVVMFADEDETRYTATKLNRPRPPSPNNLEPILSQLYRGELEMVPAINSIETCP